MKKITFIVAIILACVVHETRAVIYTVTNNLDNNTATGVNQGDLRYCINQALITAGAPHTINFNITPLAATYTINVGSVYNLYTSQLIINATSQPGWVSAPIVILNGGNATTDAFQLNGGGPHTIKGFVIQNFTQHGILANAGNGNSIIGNYIGTNAAGTVAAPNGTQDQNHAGLFVQGATNIIITGNVISGNVGNGIRIEGASAGSVIKGNFIGTNPTGLAAISNTAGGIRIEGSNNHIVGGTTAAERNIISGNGGVADGTGPNQYDVTLQCGIYFNNVLNSSISGNYIGVDATGLATSMALGNVYCGVKIEGNSTGNTIGGINATYRNIIGGNGFKITTVGAKGYRGHGIQLKGTGVNTNTVTANYVGLGVDGTTPLGNRQDGVSILGVQNNIIGGNTANLRNVIANNDWGVFIQSDFNGSQSSGNIIIGNYIGTDATGTVAIGNGTRGIDVDEGGGVGVQHGSTGNYIGRDNTGEGNVISGNKVGVEFRQGGVLGVPSANFVYNNYIGVDKTGNTALPNSGTGTTDPTYYGNGVVLGAGSTANSVGGTGLRRNIISGNNQNGVLADNTTANLVQGNYIGLNVGGTATIPNGQNGVSIVNASSTNTIGGATAALANTISGNPLNGILISASTSNTIQANLIGTNPAGTAAFANSQNGISLVSASTGNSIGGTTAGMGNTISGNTMNGISLSASGTNTIQGNFIGTNSTGAGAVPNALAGIAIANLSNANIIGGAAAGARNIISANTTSGIVIDNSDNTVIKGNSIGTAANGTSNLGNTQQGILLGNGTNNTAIGGLLAGEGNIIAYNGINGVTITDAASFNNNINRNSIFCNVRRGIELNGVGNNNYAKPVITITSTTTNLVGTAPANAYIEIFTVGPTACKTCTGSLTNDSLQGKIYVSTVQADASGNWTYNNGTPFTSDVTVTASSNNTGNYNTSEFSLCRITCTSAVAPTSGSSNLNNFCSNVGGNIILSATGGSGSVLEWFTGSCGGTSIGTSATTLTIAAPTATTTYYVRWNAVGTGSCTNSTCVPVTVTVTPAPVAPTSGSSNLNNFCSNVGGNITLSATGGGSGSTMEWFTGSCGGISIGTTATTLSITAPTVTTTYYVRWNGNGSCANSTCASVPVTVTPAPVAPTSGSSNLNNFCSNVGGNITLSATAGSGAIMEWFTGSCGGTSIGTTATTLSITAPTVTTTYYVRWNGAGTCANSTCATVPVTVTPAPVAPTSGSSNLNNFCSNAGGNIILSATGGGSGSTLEWFTGSCGGTSIGTTATTLSIAAPTATTTYYVRWNGNGSCANSTCASVPVTVTPAPVAPTSGSSNLNNFCSNVGGNITLSATGGGSGSTLEWFTGSCGGTSIGTTATTLSITAPTVTTTYYVRWNGNGSCANSTCASVPVTVTPAPVAPTSGSSNLNNFCSNVGGNIILSATGGSGATMQWFTGSCGGTSIGTTATTLSITAPTVTTTYYVRWNGAGTCANSTCVTVPVTVTPAPVAPTSGSSNLNNFCSNVGGNIILSATGGGSGSTLEWFTGSCGGTSIGTTATTLTIPAPTATTTYFVRWNGNGTCASSSCASVPVTVTPAPVAPTSGSSNNNNFCSNAGGNIVLSATAGSGAILEWFTGSCGGTSIGTTATTLTIPSPTATTTYYVRWNGAGTCANSTCVSVPVTVTPTPVAPTAGSSNLNNFCSNVGGNIVLTATSTGANIEWFTGSCGGTSLGIVASTAGLTIPAPTVSTTYFVRTNGTGACANSGCFSVPVTVTPAPVAPTSGSSNNNNFCSNVGGNIILSATGGGSGSALEWFTGSCGGTSIGTTATTLTIPAPTVTTTYYVRWNGNGTCTNSTCASVPVTVVPAPVAPTSGSSNNNNFCSNTGGNIILSAVGGSGSTLEWFTGSCGGTSVGTTATTLTIPAPTVTTTYYVRWNGTGACASSSTTCVTVPVTVIPAPVAPTSGSSNNNNFCSNVGGNIILSATGGSGSTLEWFTGSCGGTSIGTSATTLTIPAPTVTTTYYVRWNGSGACAGSNTTCVTVPVTVTPAPVAPTSGASNLNNYCSNIGGNIILSATGGSGSTLEWFTGSCGGTSIGTTATTLSIPAPIVTTTYYVRWNGNGTCASSNCSPVPVTVTVATAPVAPTSAASNISNLCSNTGGNIILSATGGSGSNMEWFTSSCGGTSLGTTTTTITIPAPSSTTTYYVRWNGAGSCISSNCATVPVTVHQLPTDPTSPATDRNGFCSNDAGNITLTASAGAGETLVWYTGSCVGGTQVGTGSSLVIASPSSSTVYFAKMESASCPASNCVQVNVNVSASPAPSITGSVFTVCANATNVNFSTTSTSNNFVWSINNGGSVVGLNNLNTVSVNLGTSDATITVTETNPSNSTCSGTDSKIITVNLPSGATAYAGPDRKICTDGVQLLADTAAGLWTVANGTGAERFSPDATKYNATVSGLSLGTDTLVWTVSGSCGYIASDKVVITVSVSDLQVKVAGPSDTACFGTERELDITNVSGGSGTYIFTWSSSDNSFNNITYNRNTTSIVKPQGTLTTYYVTVSDGQNLGCGAVDSAKVNAIEDQHLVIPNLITPNEDGKNDVWVLKDQFGNNILPGTFVEVTNRWGQFVYRNSNYDNTWGGKATADGVYYYYMKTGCGNKTLKGWLEIVSGGSN